MTDHRDPFVLRDRQPSEHWRRAERGKQRVRHQGHSNTLDAVAGAQRVGERVVDGEVFDEPRLLTVVDDALVEEAELPRQFRSRRDGAQEQQPVGMRVGIFTGPLVAGSMGSAERLEYTVIGDTVNTAARLESYRIDGDNSPCRILIGEATLLLVRDAVEVELVGELELKGKATPVTVYRVTAVRQPAAGEFEKGDRS